MDPPRDSPPMMAPGRSSPSYSEERRASSSYGATVEAPVPERTELPPIYEHIATPETQEEYYHGELRLKVPAKSPHATQHLRLAYVLEAHVADGYMGAVEMLTRTDHDTDFAPDASIFPVDPGENIGEKRQLEVMAFEVCSEQDLRVPAGKARDLIQRGVKRVFCVVVGGPAQKRRPNLEQSYVAQWSTATDAWSRLPDDNFIEDDCLSSPMPVKALIDATRSDDAVVRALQARGNRALQAIREEGKAEGHTEGKAEGLAEGQALALISILETRDLALTDEDRQQILGCRDLARLKLWMRQALSIDSVDKLFGD